MGHTRFDNDVFVAGTLRCTELEIPASTITNTDVAAGAEIAATKLEHQHQINYPIDGAVSAVTVPIYTVRGATGTIVAFECAALTAATGAATLTLDLKAYPTSATISQSSCSPAATSFLS